MTSALKRAAAALALRNMRDIGADVRLGDLTDQQLLHLARGVVEVIREPTESMAEVGGEAGHWSGVIYAKHVDATEPERVEASLVWRAMIDAALAEEG